VAPHAGGADTLTDGAMHDVLTTPARTPATVRIEPARGLWRSLGLREAWTARELLLLLAWRDIRVRYKQTVFGAAWALIQPLLTMVVFSIFFGRLAKVPSDGIPYPLFAAAALVPWTYFSNALSQSSMSLVATPDLITKIYFPRVLIPCSAVLAGLLDFAIAFVVLVVMALAYGEHPGAEVLVVVPLLALTVVTVVGVGLWLAALNVQYRDVRYALPFVVQLWLFVTPIAYPSSLLDEPWQTLFGLNPMAGVVEGFRWALTGADTAPGPMVIVSAVTALVLLVTGLLYFKRVEDRFADVV
jgi:lipopolysaccharide transport system permease protein